MGDSAKSVGRDKPPMAENRVKGRDPGMGAASMADRAGGGRWRWNSAEAGAGKGAVGTGNAGTWVADARNAGAEVKGAAKGIAAGKTEVGTKGKAEVAALAAAPVRGRANGVAFVVNRGKAGKAGEPAVVAAVKAGADPEEMTSAGGIEENTDAAWGCAVKDTVAKGIAGETAGSGKNDEAPPEGTEAAPEGAVAKGAWAVPAGPRAKAKAGTRKGFVRAASRYEVPGRTWEEVAEGSASRKLERKAVAACAEDCAAEGLTKSEEGGSAGPDEAAGIPGVTAREREVASRAPHGAEDPKEEVEAPERAPKAKDEEEFELIETITR